MSMHYPLIVNSFGVDGYNNKLFAEFQRQVAHQLRVAHCGRIYGNLVGTVNKEIFGILHARNAATDCERNREVFGNRFHERINLFSALVCGGDVEIYKFVNALLRIRLAEFHGVARVPKVLKTNAFHRLSVLDVEARYNSFCQHFYSEVKLANWASVTRFS